jgi:hypothetical protein
VLSKRAPGWRGERESKHHAFPQASDIDLLGRLDVAHDDRPVTRFDVFVVQRCQQRERTPVTGQHCGLSTREHTIAEELSLPYTTGGSVAR